MPKDGYFYDENVVANLLSLGKIANEFNLYCMELQFEEEKEDCFFGTVKGKMAIFSKMDVNQVEPRKTRIPLGCDTSQVDRI